MSNLDGSSPELLQLQRFDTRRLPGRVNEELRRLIALDAFPSGKLPREEDLAARLGVSRTTLRTALRSLEEQGLITRVRGVGTSVNRHVAQSAIALNQVVGFYQLMEEAGYRPKIAWTRLRETTADKDTAERLGRRAPILEIQRLLLAHDEPALHLTENVSAGSLAKRPTEDNVPNSIFEFADEYCTTPIDHTVVEVTSAAADASCASDLGVKVHQPVLRLVESHYSLVNDPFIVSRITIRDDRLRILVVRRRP